MAYLGDYIGYLMSEITNARAQADYEAVRIAEQYAKDPYLKHMPIPHFRMPSVSIDIPLIINNVEEPDTGRYSNDQMLSYMQAKFRKILPKQLDNISTSKLRTNELNRISKRTDSIFASFKQLDQSPIRITYIADKLVSSVTEELKKNTLPDKLNIDDFTNDLREQLYSEFSKYLRRRPRLDITANTAEIKNAGPKDILAYIRFTITEETFEWTTVEEANIKTRRLVPE